MKRLIIKYRKRYVGNTSITFGDININAPNVTDVKSLVAEIKSSPELQNVL